MFQRVLIRCISTRVDASTKPIPRIRAPLRPLSADDEHADALVSSFLKQTPMAKSSISDEPSLSYFIRRTEHSLSLPIYLNYSHQGHRIITLLRHIDGNVQELMKDLINENIIPKDRFIPSTAGILRIQGDFRAALKSWLIERGF